mmetsp:Transcript_28018/g.77070  ORF Transcript_28018/g.77070 Transcript_28018/m.77070 type:complete len:145 (-) Transcript_28018:334-768(-)
MWRRATSPGSLAVELPAGLSALEKGKPVLAPPEAASTEKRPGQELLRPAPSPALGRHSGDGPEVIDAGRRAERRSWPGCTSRSAPDGSDTRGSAAPQPPRRHRSSMESSEQKLHFLPSLMVSKSAEVGEDDEVELDSDGSLRLL